MTDTLPVKEILDWHASFKAPQAGFRIEGDVHITGTVTFPTGGIEFDPAGTEIEATDLILALKELEARVSGIEGPVNTELPAITGTAEPDEEQTCSEGTWAGVADITYEYQWFRDGVAIEDEEEDTYTTVTEDEGTEISCRVTATNAYGSNSVFAEAVEIPAAPEEG
jgi:hypothetical protein